MINSCPIAHLREAISRLQQLLARVQPAAQSTTSIHSYDLAVWRADLANAAAWLKLEIAPSSEAAQRNEFLLHLREFARLLPGLHLRLLIERDRLASRRIQLANATAWSETRKKTL